MTNRRILGSMEHSSEHNGEHSSGHTPTDRPALVLVTGGSGFLGAHCVVQLLNAGHRVRTTVRSAARAADVRAMVTEGGADPAPDVLTFAVADLTSDEGWAAAVAGCDYVLHVASPFPPGVPEHEDDLIVPAREGTLRVLRAARDAKVRRVVLTSSFAAVGYGRPASDRPFTEESWTDPAADLSAYVKSKAVAERAAWDFAAGEGGGLELTVVNPVGIFGPVLGPDYAASIGLVKLLMDGGLPGTPRLSFGVVDVRDVADLHLRAMTDPAAPGERFLATSGGVMSMHEIAVVLKSGLGEAAARVPTRKLPDLVVRIVALGVPRLRPMVPDLGKVRPASGDKARRVLGWSARPQRETIVDTAESLVRHGLLRAPR